MRAVVLVGGQGTRLRPLTETIKKELLPLAGRPSLDRVLDHLARHGVRRVVLSSSYLEDTFAAFVAARSGDPAITWITEPEPLDTGGAIAQALPHLGDEPFFALNGDILTDLDLSAMAAFHRERAAAVTIALHRVQDARAFGLVAVDEGGRVRAFREKPAEAIGGDVNAGTYIIDPPALDRWAGGIRVNIEREIFPTLIEEGVPMFGFASGAYWLDLGTPEKYLQANADLLDGRVTGEPRLQAPLVDPTASLDEGVRIGPHVVLGSRVSVASGAEVDDSVVMDGASIEAGATVRRSILGPRSRVGAGASIDGAVLGEGAEVGEGAALDGVRVSANARAG